ncbi:MAG: sarcosine oxidase subunit gamma family protein [Actinomycetota bacterium]|nr:sarcosine oxidase subunit gamma family protein [Actinomycetota bacterium]
MDTARIHEDLKIEVPVEEELLAACECALEWFEDWSKHADHDHDFGGEHRVMQRLRRALAEVWIREEL